MQVIGLDFETYYDKDYSLRKMSTTDYIRDPRFKVHGVSIRLQGEDTATFYGPTAAAIQEGLQSIPWSDCVLVCHNAPFDCAILSYHYGLVPASIRCTMAMARGMLAHNRSVALDAVGEYLGLGRKVAGALSDIKGVVDLSLDQYAALSIYAVQDVDLMMDIYDDLIGDYPELELELIEMTVRFYTEPMFVGNIELAKEEYDREVEAKRAILQRVADLLALPDLHAVDKKLASNKIFPTVLESFGAECPMKYSEKQDKMVPALAKNDLDFQALLEHPNEDVVLLCEARLNVKSTIAETRAERFIRYATTGAVPIMLHMYGAHTHRWSGGDKFNPQNFPRKSLLREALQAPPGYKILVIDSAQIEARVLAYLAGQDDLLASFADPHLDPYCMMASEIYGREITKADELERFVGKVAVLGLGYGMGSLKFMNTLASGAMGPKIVITPQEAERAKGVYRHANAAIVDFWANLEQILNRMVQGQTTEAYGMTFEPDAVLMPNGLYVQYPQLQGVVNPYTGQVGDFTYQARRFRTNLYGGKFAENIVQSYARSLVAWQILQVRKKYRPLLAVHDEGVFLVPENEVVEAKRFAMKAFRTAPDWAKGIPLDAEVKVADHYCK